MSRIQATTGVISGIPITDTVDQLMKVEARPRDLLTSRSQALQAQQVAISELTAVVIGVQLGARKLAAPSLFQQRTVKSSNQALLTATVAKDASPTVGSFKFTAVRQATSQQVLSSGFASKTSPIGEGEFNLQFGGFVDTGVALNELNGGAGVQRGKIRITDRSGQAATVDLRFAQTIDDVLQAINTTDSIQVNAVAEGDHIKLVDRSGGTTANLKVQEVGGGSTANDLGLSTIDAAATSAAGRDVVKLYNGLNLDRLNDGNGLSIRKEVSDLKVTLRDGTSLEIDVQRKARDADFAKATTTGVADAQITLTAKTKGAALDGMRIQYVDDALVTAGSETVVYDESDPAHKTLTVHVAAGSTTADNVIAAINNNATVSAKFGAAKATGSDGTGLVTINDTAVTIGGAALTIRKEKTLGELLQTINEVDPTRLKAELSTDGDRIVLTDLTTDTGGTFAITSTTGGTLAQDLGLTGTASGGTLTSGRLVGGLKSTLLRSFNGGSGLGTLGNLSITDRAGATATVDLSGAQTLDDVIKSINDSSVGVEARINSARNGLEIVDTTGDVASSLIIASGDATGTAEKLKVAINSATERVNSGNLARQSISESTLLSSLNGGKGVARTSFFVSNSTGATSVIRLDNEAIQTVGDLLDAINGLSVGLDAHLNAKGDGIELVDTAGGSGVPSVRDVGNGTAAKDLHLDGGAEEVVVSGQPKKFISGSQSRTLKVSATDTLENVVTKINALGGGYTASILTDGSGQLPHRLSIQSAIIGDSGNLLVDTNFGGVKFEELTTGHDALLQLASGDNGSGVLVSSKTNTFENAVAGINVTLTGQSTETVTVGVTQNDSTIVSSVQLFVDQYNKLRDKLASQTSFSTTDFKTGVLFGSGEALRVDTELSNLLSGRFFGAGDIHSLKEIGLDLNDAGKLTFDSTKLQAKYASNPDAVTKFFTTEKNGFASKVDKMVETMAGVKNSLLVNRVKSLQSRIDVYSERIDFWNERLVKKRDALLKKFYDLETALGKLQANSTAVNGIQVIPPLGSQ
jgi:flagellar hook-associated protein 2